MCIMFVVDSLQILPRVRFTVLGTKSEGGSLNKVALQTYPSGALHLRYFVVCSAPSGIIVELHSSVCLEHIQFVRNSTTKLLRVKIRLLAHARSISRERNHFSYIGSKTFPTVPC